MVFADLLDDLPDDAPAAPGVDRRPLRERAADLVHRAFDVIDTQIGGDVDLRDAGDLIPKVARVVEHFDKLELAARGPTLATVHINIGAGGQIAARVERDAGAAEVVESVAATLPPPAPPGAFALEFEPLTEGDTRD